MSMKAKVSTFVTASLLFALAAAPASFAQDAGLVSVLEVRVQLSHQQQYESAIPKLWSAFKKAGVKHPITVSTSVDEPGTYTFVTPVTDFADFGALRDSVNKAFASAPQVMGEVTGMSTSQTQSVWAVRPDLSYAPATPRLKDGEQGFTRVAFVYPRPDQVQAFEASLKEAAVMYQKHGITDPRSVGQLLVGENAPAYAVLLPAKDETDFYVQNAKNLQKMGADWPAYLTKTAPMLRDVELTGARALPALTYQP